jgi:rubredoxin
LESNDSTFGTVKTFIKSQIVFEEDAEGSTMYLLRQGKVKILLGGKDGVEVGTLETPGDFFGEMSLIDGSSRSATIFADDDNTELEVLDRESFLEMIRATPEFALQVMHELCERVRLGNVLYFEVVKGAMAPFCRQNCLAKTMDAFARNAVCAPNQKARGEIEKGTKWRCATCDYVYVPEYGDPKNGIPAGTPFEELPDHWRCPECGVRKSAFQKVG